MSPTSLHRLAKLCTLCALCTLSAAAALAPQSAQAFCGFYVSGSGEGLYNDATQVVLMRDGKRTILSMQNHYDGPPEDFAMVVPVPVVLKEADVKTLPKEVFSRVDLMDSPRLVEYWEQDPCAQSLLFGSGAGLGGLGGIGSDGGGGGGGGVAPAVKIEAQFEVGEYEVVILSATDSMALDTWLRAEKYNIPAGAEPVLRPYIESGMFFFVAKVNLKEVQREDGRAVLSPLRFHYDTDTFQLPVRLGLLNARGPQDLIIHVLASQRYEAANLPNVTIPTNIEVKAEVKGRFAEFYAALFDDTLTKHPGAVVTEYAWDARSCDPCPGPVLSTQDLLTLGADVLPGQTTQGFVLTRLHARYTAADLKDDIVFKAAAPIMGGREVYASDKWGDVSALERGAVEGGVNNFQGRYAIRYPWTGEIACDAPQRGVWGGPPTGGDAPPVAAQDAAFAPRGGLDLTGAVASEPARWVASDLSALPPAPPAPPLFGGPMMGGPGVGIGSVGPQTRLTSPAPKVEGTYDEKIVARVVKQRHSALLACYRRTLALNPSAPDGKLTLTWQVNTDGIPADVRATANTVGDTALADCAVTQVKRAKFPAPAASIQVTQDLIFKVTP